MEKTISCPYCDGLINQGAKKCKHCGEWINNQEGKTALEGKDERETCAGCGKKMVPRIILGPPLVHGQGGYTPVPKKSVCPYCGTVHKKFPASTGEVLAAIIFGMVILIVVVVVIGGNSHK